MTDPLGALMKFGKAALIALKPHGPAPIVTVILAVLGTIALLKGAPQISTIALVIVCFAFFFFAQERRHIWRKRELEVEYDALERKAAITARKKIEGRIERKKNMMPALPFPPQETPGGRDD